jgi:hypothetical protein
VIILCGCRADAWIDADALEHASLILHFHQQRETELHMPTPGINGALFHLEADHVLRAHIEQLHHGMAEIISVMIDGEENLGEL